MKFRRENMSRIGVLGLIVSILGMTVILLLLPVIGVSQKTALAPQELVEKFFEACQANRLEEAYAMLSARTQKETSQERFQEYVKSPEGELFFVLGIRPTFRDVKVEKAQMREDSAQAQVDISFPLYASASLLLIKENGSWKIDFTEAREAAGAQGLKNHAAICQSNLKQLGLAMLMYAQDYDGRLPISFRWCDALYPYVKDVDVFNCPGDKTHKYSFAMNSKLCHTPLSKIQKPAETVLLFESKLGHKNDTNAGMTVCDNPARHEGGNNFLFVDGHVKWVKLGTPLNYDAVKGVSEKESAE